MKFRLLLISVCVRVTFHCTFCVRVSVILRNTKKKIWCNLFYCLTASGLCLITECSFKTTFKYQCIYLTSRSTRRTWCQIRFSDIDARMFNITPGLCSYFIMKGSSIRFQNVWVRLIDTSHHSLSCVGPRIDPSNVRAVMLFI